MIIILKHSCPQCGANQCYLTNRFTSYKNEIHCSSCNKTAFIDKDKFCQEDIETIKKFIESYRSRSSIKDTKIQPLQTPVFKSTSEVITKTAQLNQQKKEIPLSSQTARLTRNVFYYKLPHIIEGYRKRQSQLDLANIISITADFKGKLIAEAGVGTGKSLTYLISSINYKEAHPEYKNHPVLISTKTISLQEQLIEKDIPKLKEIFPSLEYILAKGQLQYLCIKRYKANEKKIFEIIGQDDQNTLRDWALKSRYRGEDNDRRNSPVIIPDDAWDLMNVQYCGLEDCPHEDRCLYSLHKRERMSFNGGLIVTNHNQLVSDLRIRQRRGGLWPSPCMIVIDEAHGLESAVRNELAQEISTSQIFKLQQSCRKVRVLERYVDPNVYIKVDNTLDDFIEVAEEFYNANTDGENSEVHIPNDPKLIRSGERFLKTIRDLYNNIDRAYAGYITYRDEKQIERVSGMIEKVIENISDWLESPDHYFLSCQRKNENLIIKINPTNISGFLKNVLWSKNIPVILLSGTLTSNGSFAHIKEKLGLKHSREFLGPVNMVPADNVAFYVASDLPKPNKNEEEDKEFIYACADRIVQLLKCSGGRSLVLFTSHRRLNKVYDLLLKRDDIPWKLLHQRDRHAIQYFREDKSSVLLATGSYWEGIDVLGDALIMVIMDKLPYPSPTNPLITARTQALTEQGKSEQEIIQELYLPEMLLQLKQGAGRLLRHETDWGAIAILDPRAGDEELKDMVSQCIPPHTPVNDIKCLAEWFKAKQDGKGKVVNF